MRTDQRRTIVWRPFQRQLDSKELESYDEVSYEVLLCKYSRVILQYGSKRSKPSSLHLTFPLTGPG